MGRTGLRAGRQKLGRAERDSGLDVRGSDGQNGTPGGPSEARMDGTGLRAGRQKLGWAERKTSLRSKKSQPRAAAIKEGRFFYFFFTILLKINFSKLPVEADCNSDLSHTV